VAAADPAHRHGHGTGYASHNACAVTDVAGRDDPETDLPPNPLVPYLQLDVGGDEITASLFGALAWQRRPTRSPRWCSSSTRSSPRSADIGVLGFILRHALRGRAG